MVFEKWGIWFLLFKYLFCWKKFFCSAMERCGGNAFSVHLFKSVYQWQFMTTFREMGFVHAVIVLTWATRALASVVLCGRREKGGRRREGGVMPGRGAGATCPGFSACALDVAVRRVPQPWRVLALEVGQWKLPRK